jgi:hypothetical protein
MHYHKKTPGDFMTEWRKCTTCKKEIAFLQKYWICNVSTCQRKRTGLVFCTLECWDAHLPVFRHKEAWAEERQAPSERVWAEVLAGTRPDPTYPERKREVEVPNDDIPKGPKPFDPAKAGGVVIRRRGQG